MRMIPVHMAYNVIINLETKPKTCEMFSIVYQGTESKSCGSCPFSCVYTWGGVYSNIMHPSIITINTLTHSFELLGIMHLYINLTGIGATLWPWPGLESLLPVYSTSLGTVSSRCWLIRVSALGFGIPAAWLLSWLPCPPSRCPRGRHVLAPAGNGPPFRE